MLFQQDFCICQTQIWPIKGNDDIREGRSNEGTFTNASGIECLPHILIPLIGDLSLLVIKPKLTTSRPHLI